MNISIERHVWIAFGTKKEKELLSPHLYRESVAITSGFDLEIGQRGPSGPQSLILGGLFREMER